MLLSMLMPRGVHSENTVELELKLLCTIFSSTAARSAALAISFLFWASPTRAESITLICETTSEITPSSNNDSWTLTLRVDYHREVVELLNPDGTVKMSGAATVTESNVTWSGDNTMVPGYDTRAKTHFDGMLNRLTGHVVVGTLNYFDGHRQYGGPCRRATQKF